MSAYIPEWYKEGLEVKFQKNGVEFFGRLFMSYVKEWMIERRDNKTGLTFFQADTVKYLRPAEGFWPIPGEVLTAGSCEYKVLAWIDDAYFLEGHSLRSREELMEYGYKLKSPNPEPPILELTLDQIAEKFGVDPKRVRVKKGGVQL